MSKPSPSNPRRIPRIPEIAAAAGVSASTVDRVLNERGNVSAALQRKVVEAARRLQARRVLPSVRRGVLRFDVVIPGTGVAHYVRIDRAVQHYAQLIGARASIHRSFWNDADEAALLRFLQRPPHPRAGLLLMTRDVERVRSCVRGLQRSGLPVVTITSGISDIAPHVHVGIDNVMAGRTAAYLTGRFARPQGRVLLLTTSLEFREHVERVAGFRKVMSERFPGLRIEAPVEHFDRIELAHAAVRDALARHDDIVGIYNAGSAAHGVHRALRGLPLQRRPAWISHEVTFEHAELMRRGFVSAVIDQDPETQALTGLQHLLHACGELDEAPATGPTRFRIVTPENLLESDLVA